MKVILDLKKDYKYNSEDIKDLPYVRSTKYNSKAHRLEIVFNLRDSRKNRFIIGWELVPYKSILKQ